MTSNLLCSFNIACIVGCVVTFKDTALIPAYTLTGFIGIEDVRNNLQFDWYAT